MKYLFSHILIGLFFLNNCNLKKADETFFILDIASLTGSNFKVAGSLTGLTSGSLTLQLNGSESLILSQDGNFEFATSLATGSSYEVTVSSQPSNFYCATANASGTVLNVSISNLTVTCNAGKRIFVTASNYNGDLTADIGSGAYANGILGADARCMADANKPTTGTFKAMIVDDEDRRACSTDNCTTSGTAEHIDWVLSPNAKYIREPGSASLFTTNSRGIFVFGTMDAPFASMGSVQTWGGFTTIVGKWQTSSSDCSNWTTSGAGSNGRVGSTNQTDYTAIRNSNSIACNQNHHLLCVEQ